MSIYGQFEEYLGMRVKIDENWKVITLDLRQYMRQLLENTIC